MWLTICFKLACKMGLGVLGPQSKPSTGMVREENKLWKAPQKARSMRNTKRISRGWHDETSQSAISPSKLKTIVTRMSARMRRE